MRIIILLFSAASAIVGAEDKPADRTATCGCTAPSTSKWSCAFDDAKRECEWQFKQRVNRRESQSLVAAGRAYLTLKNPILARDSCAAGLKLDPTYVDASACVSRASAEIRTVMREELDALLQAIDLEMDRGETERAIAIIDRIEDRLKAPELAADAGFYRNKAAALLHGPAPARPKSGVNTAAVGDWIADLEALFSPKSWTRRFALDPKWVKDLMRVLWYAALIGLAIVVAYFVINAIRFIVTKGRTYMSDRPSFCRTWIVWSVTDDGSRGAAGAVIEALDPKHNPLLQRKQFSAFPIMLIPIGNSSGRDRIPVWKSLPQQPPFDVEYPPDTQKNRFSLQEAFEDIDFKVGRLEAKGVVTLIKALNRWWNKGLPAARGHVTSSASNREVAVRLTCSRPRETISVYASGADLRGVDALRLAAQRAAYKVYFRLMLSELARSEGHSVDGTSEPANRALQQADETSVAALRQGVDILRMYL